MAPLASRKNKAKAMGTAVGPNSSCVFEAKKDTPPSKAVPESVFQNAFQGNVLFTSSLNLPKFGIYPVVPKAKKPAFVSPQELILLSSIPRADLETGLLMCYWTVRAKMYHSMEAESTHWHK